MIYVIRDPFLLLPPLHETLMNCMDRLWQHMCGVPPCFQREQRCPCALRTVCGGDQLTFSLPNRQCLTAGGWLL